MEKLRPKDFSNENEIKWCPGCGDHAILKHLQSAMAKSGSRPENTAVISGIGCSSRLPYYMNTHGFHTIHGRALPIAVGFKKAQPDMDVWVVTGDGDSLSIGTNHYIHFFRKNLDINILLFNNSIYGLTKGQYSPTSPQGQKSKSSPYGSQDSSLNALSLALNSGASMICRTSDRDSAYIQEYMIASKEYQADSLIEILQNCPIFNDEVFEKYTSKSELKENIVRLEDGEVLKFGENDEWTIILEEFKMKKVKLDSVSNDKLWIHDNQNIDKAKMLVKLGYDEYSDMPLPLGIIFKKEIESRNNANFDDYQTEIMTNLNDKIIEIR